MFRILSLEQKCLLKRSFHKILAQRGIRKEMCVTGVCLCVCVFFNLFI